MCVCWAHIRAYMPHKLFYYFPSSVLYMLTCLCTMVHLGMFDHLDSGVLTLLEEHRHIQFCSTALPSGQNAGLFGGS